MKKPMTKAEEKAFWRDAFKDFNPERGRFPDHERAVAAVEAEFEYFAPGSGYMPTKPGQFEPKR